MPEVLNRYLGDGLFIRRWNNGYELYTTNGIETTNTIYLEPEVAVALIAIITKDMKPQ